ncbi:MAG: type II toxin-antitoxin system PemK/MazF family toxin [Bacteroidota bacterium]
MQSFSKSRVVLVKYPFTDLENFKIRPAVIISKSLYDDVFIVPLTSRIAFLNDEEFILHDWKKSGLNVETAVKKGIYTIESKLIIKEIGHLTKNDFDKLKLSILKWLEF